MTSTSGVTDGSGTVSRRRSPLVVVVLIALLLVMVGAIAAPLLTPYSPGQQDLALGVSAPSPAHWLGTDELGRDLLSRLVAGARAALLGPLVIAVVTVMVGAALGTVAGMFGGWLDAVITRFADLVYALPALLVAVVLTGVVGGGYLTAMAIVTLFSVPTAIRMTRSATLSRRGLAYVDAARTLGLSSVRIVVRHILPAIMPTIVATALLDFVAALTALSSLSFLGIGVPPGAADWGRMIADGREIVHLNTWAVAAPAAALAVTAVVATIVGDRLYDRFRRPM